MTATVDGGQIFDAVQAGDVARVQALLAEDPGVAADRNADGLPVLLFARYRGAMAIVDTLLAAGQPLDVFEAAATGRVDRVAELLGADRRLALAWAPDG